MNELMNVILSSWCFLGGKTLEWAVHFHGVWCCVQWKDISETISKSLVRSPWANVFPSGINGLVQMALWCSVFGWEQSRRSVASYEWRIQNYISIETLPTQSSFLCIAFPRCHSCITVWRLCSFLLPFPLLFTNVIPKKSKWGVPESCHSTTLLETDSFFKKF